MTPLHLRTVGYHKQRRIQYIYAAFKMYQMKVSQKTGIGIGIELARIRTNFRFPSLK